MGAQRARPRSKRRRQSAGLAALVLAALGFAMLAVAATRGGSHAARASELLSVEMDVVYPAGDAWETVHLVLLLEDSGGDFRAAAAEARAGMLARIPGGLEVSPEVAGQYVTNDIKHANGKAEWWYNGAGKPAGLEGDYAAMQAAASAWNYAGGANFHFTDGGLTTDPADICDGGGRDGRNTVGWADLPGNTLGLTCYMRGSIVEFDIQYDTTKTWTTSLAGVDIDLQTVATHEFGHAAGLGHTDDRSAVMWGSYRRGTVLRTPTTDDLAGLVFIYGLAAATPTATVSPVSTPTRPGAGSVPQVVVPGLSRQ